METVDISKPLSQNLHHRNLQTVRNFVIMSSLLVDTYLNESNKHDGGNYVNWKFKLLTILEGYNLWSVVSGDEP